MKRYGKIVAGFCLLGSITIHCVAYAVFSSAPDAVQVSGGIISVDFGENLDPDDTSDVSGEAAGENPPIEEPPQAAVAEAPKVTENVADDKDMRPLKPVQEPPPELDVRDEAVHVKPIDTPKELVPVIETNIESESNLSVDSNAPELEVAPSTLATQPIYPPTAATVRTATGQVAAAPVSSFASTMPVEPSASITSDAEPTVSAPPSTQSAAFGFDPNTPISKEASAKYGALVMKHLMRRKKPRTVQAGATVIGFELNRDGSINRAEVVKSSGSKRFDREALKYVKRAAPFPMPPDSADLNFRVEVKSG